MAETPPGADVTAAELTHPAVIADPYPYYDRLRPSSPCYGYADHPPGTVPGLDPPTAAWTLLRYADVAAAARDHDTFSSADFQRGSSAPTLMLVNHDPPQHGRLRRIVSKAFTPKRIADLGPFLDALIARRLTNLANREIDALDDLAADIPGDVMVHLIGLPADDARHFKHWANAFMLSAPMTPEERGRSNEELGEYFATHVRDARASAPSGDADAGLLAALLAAETDGQRLTDDEVTRFLISLVVAGSETTMYFLVNCIAVLVDHPDVFARLRADRTLIRRFLDETLRLTGPPQRLFRRARRDVEIGGQLIREGEWVALFFGAANHDPDVFPHPHEFDLDRPNVGDHLSYGIGIHYCLGAPLASLEAHHLVAALCDHYAAIDAGSRPRVPQTASLLQHGYTTLPIVLRSAPDTR